MEKADDTGKKILVVEDEPSISDVCRRVLTAEGFNVELAANGKVAKEMMGKGAYDLYLIDIKTPALNGMDLYKWFQEKYPELTWGVIFTTGSVLDGNIGSFLEDTGKPLLPKPFTPDELKSIVKQTLQPLS